MKSYCPQCVRELAPDKKKLGERINWLVCPECGHRERPNTKIEDGKYTRDRIQNSNRNLNKFNTYSENDY